MLYSGLALAADDGDRLTPQDVARLRMVSEARISPQGGHIAYVRSVPRRPGQEENGPAWTELHVVDVATSQSRPFISGEVSIAKIAWTPDGRGISFLTKRGNDKEMSLYVIPLDGGEARRLAGGKTAIEEYAFSPQGSQVAYVATESPPEPRQKLAEQGFNAQVYEEDVRQKKIWLVDADVESTDDPRLVDLAGSASELHWSPDGQRFVVALAPSPSVDDNFMYRRLRIVDAASGQISVSIENPGKLGAVAWSLDGAHIAFLSGQDIHDPSEGRLMVARAADGSFRELMPDYPPNISSLAWRDSRTLAFIADDGCLTAVGEVTLDGGAPRMLIPTGGAILSELSASADGQHAACLGMSPQHPAEVFRFAWVAGEVPRRLTDNNPWLAQKRLATQEIVRYQARDGEAIEGVLVRPLDEEAGRTYPLILAVHGGPEAHVAHGWVTTYSLPGQVAAARGIAVFHPNYRGSTGRGVAFAKAHQGDYAGKEFNDLIDGIDHLANTGLVDAKRVGITGGSYGGFATAWCSTFHSERFAAGVMFVGISDHVSKAGTTDIPDEMYLVHARKRLWDDYQFFLERSPIYHVRKAKTPLLILHGKDDTRVPTSQSLELYRHLKELGQTPVRLVLYPGEGHGNRKAAARLDYNLRMLRWLEHYLLGPGGAPPPYAIDYGLPAPEASSAESK